ncbi:hypothetical protein ABBQ38_001614 [Trebouxia sp. C0009 RCD-2024]
MTKKRKAELDLDVERNLHSSFVTAANSISHLFTQAIQQNKKAQVAGAQQALERQIAWVLKEYGNAQYVPISALLGHLQQEIQHVDALESQQPQAPGFPAGATGYEPTSDSSMGDHPQHKFMRHSLPQQLTSPMKRQVNAQTGLYSFGHDMAMGTAQDNPSGFFAHHSTQ